MSGVIAIDRKDKESLVRSGKTPNSENGFDGLTGFAKTMAQAFYAVDKLTSLDHKAYGEVNLIKPLWN